MAIFLALSWLLARPATAAESRLPGCSSETDYGTALCHYDDRDFETAERLFAAIVENGPQEPETLKALYFLVRSRMQLGNYAGASSSLMRIYSVDPSFYHEWGCDYLLGECRKQLGLGE